MKFRPGLLSEYSEDDPRFALSYAGGGVSGATPQGADALGRVAYGFTGAGGVQDAAGLLGGPSLPENVRGGNYLDAALQGAGVLPIVGGVAKGLLGTKIAASLLPAIGKGEKLVSAMSDAEKNAKIKSILEASDPRFNDWTGAEVKSLAEELAAAAGDKFSVTHSDAAFGPSSYVYAREGSSFDPRVRISSHPANPRPAELQLLKSSNFDVDAAIRHLSGILTPEEQAAKADKLSLAYAARDKKVSEAQSLYDELRSSGLDHKKSIGQARKIYSTFDPAKKYKK